MRKYQGHFVYILSNRSRTLYVGMTNNLARRMHEHRNKLIDGFTKTYNVTQLVYFEQAANLFDAGVREKQLKGWRREKKIILVEASIRSGRTWVQKC